MTTSLGAPFSSSVLNALAFLEGEAADSGERTLVAIAVVLAILAVVIGIGIAMDRRARA
ncbi:MAG TPA: hypothetical protein VGG39_00315 [Polyangiaceae bacterium]|jgi:hypothetical protein